MTRHSPLDITRNVMSTSLLLRRIAMSNAQTEYRYNRLTWPEMNDAIAAQKLVILPTGVDGAAWQAPAAGRRHVPVRIGLPGGGPPGAGPGAGAAADRLRAESAPHRLSRHHPHRAGDVHRLLSQHHQERRLSRLPEDPDRQRPRLEHAADRPGGPQDGARNRLALLRRRLLSVSARGVRARSANRR